MSALLHVPLDFQSLPEYRLYLVALAAHYRADLENSAPIALYGFMKLWVNLGYEAQRTNEPGLLTSDGGKLWRMEVGAVESEKVFNALVEGGVLKARGEGAYFCERFARFNEHLSGEHERKEDKGARRSAIVRAKALIGHEVNQQVMLLPPEIYKDRAGNMLSNTDVRRVLIHIRTLDRCLGLKDRQAGTYTEGLIADAMAALASVPTDVEARNQFYFWFNDNAKHPAMPKSTEQVLADWDRVMEMKRSMEKRAA